MSYQNELNAYKNYLQQQEEKKEAEREKKILAEKKAEQKYLDLIAKFNISDNEDCLVLFKIIAMGTKYYIKHPFHDSFENFMAIVTEKIGKGHIYSNTNEAKLTKRSFGTICDHSALCYRMPVNKLTFIEEKEFNEKHAKTLVFRSMVDGQVFKLDSYKVTTYMNLLISVRARFPSCKIIFKGFKIRERNFEEFKNDFGTQEFFVFY